MQFYPAYKAVDVMKMPAISFFALLNEGYRIKYANAKLSAHIAMLPLLTDETRTKFLQELDWASKSPSDILTSDDEASSQSDIKKLLG